MGEQVVVKVDTNLNESTLLEDSLPILRKIRPDWFQVPVDKGEPGDNDSKIKMKVFSGGLSNMLVGFFIENNDQDIVIFKLYGQKTELMIDREQEIQTLQLLQKRKCGPALYAIFGNGIAYEYFPGSILDVSNCRTSKIYTLVAKETAKMHSSPLTEAERKDGPCMWRILNKFNKLVIEALDSNPELKIKLEGVGLTSTWAASVIEELQQFCSKEKMPLAFCHNDLLLGNIIYNEKKSKVSFIDFEYGAPNYAPFDVANHFCEFAGTDDCDFSRCPDDEFKRIWIMEYLTHYSSSNSDEIFNVDVFLYWIHLCTPLSHLLWTLWAVIQANYSKIDFDFVHYVSLRVPECNKGIEFLRRRNSKSS